MAARLHYALNTGGRPNRSRICSNHGQSPENLWFSPRQLLAGTTLLSLCPNVGTHVV